MYMLVFHLPPSANASQHIEELRVNGGHRGQISHVGGEVRMVCFMTNRNRR